MKFAVTMTGIAATRAELAKLKARMEEPKPALRRAAVMVLDGAVSIISIGGRPPWAPFKHEPHDGHRLLILTGSLRNSLSAVDDDGPYALKVGTNIQYAAYQQNPARDGSKPGRPFLYVDKPMAEKIAAVIQRYLSTGKVG